MQPITLKVVLVLFSFVLSCLDNRVGKTGSLGPRGKVRVYCSKLFFCQNDFSLGDHFKKRTVCYNMI